MALSLDEILEQKRKVTVSVAVPLDPGLQDKLDRARLAEAEAAKALSLRDGDKGRQAVLAAAKAAVDQAETAFEDGSAVFVFEGLSREDWERLLDDHRPKEHQRSRARREGTSEFLNWDPDTFPPALIAATLVDPPGITLDKARELWESDRFNRSELEAIFSGAHIACIDSASRKLTAADLAAVGKV